MSKMPFAGLHRNIGMKKGIIRTIFLISAIWISSGYLYAEEHIDLTIPDVIEIALSNNLGLKSERISPDIQRENVETARSVFDPNVTAGGTISRLETQEDPSDAESNEKSLQVSIGKKLSRGMDVSVNLTVSDDSHKNSAGVDSDGRATLTTLVITQPLMKNKGETVNRRGIIIAENNYKKSDLGFKQAVINMVAETKNRYWQLYSAIESLTVQEKSLHLARQFMSDVEEKVRIGSAAKLDILQAKAEVASREENVIVAENKVMNSQDSLLNYVYGSLAKTGRVICRQKPSFEALQVDEEELVRQSMSARTDYLSAQYDIASVETDVAYTENQTKPQLDLVGTLGYNNGSSDAVNPSQVSTEYKDYYTAAVTLNLKFPWGFRKDVANYQAARLSLKQSRIRLEEIESGIRLEIRTAIRNVRSAHKRYQAASVSGRLAEEKLAAEQEKYENGLSTGYDVLLYQRDLTDAGVRLVDATIAYQQAIVALNKAAGITLEQNKIEIKDIVQ
ncbi:TolC family protein [Desulfobacterales bacterium HSG2]|nr:TolC family protein [Desulfobacterales bacterium HSG2]